MSTANAFVAVCRISVPDIPEVFSAAEPANGWTQDACWLLIFDFLFLPNNCIISFLLPLPAAICVQLKTRRFIWEYDSSEGEAQLLIIILLYSQITEQQLVLSIINKGNTAVLCAWAVTRQMNNYMNKILKCFIFLLVSLGNIMQWRISMPITERSSWTHFNSIKTQSLAARRTCTSKCFKMLNQINLAFTENFIW